MYRLRASTSDMQHDAKVCKIPNYAKVCKSIQYYAKGHENTYIQDILKHYKKVYKKKPHENRH